MTLKVDVNAVSDLLREIARGHVTAETWHDGGSAWFVRASGFLIEVFDDAGEADYVENVVDPSGTTATFRQFTNALGYDPIDQLSESDRKQLGERLRGDFWAARVPKKPRGKKKRR